MKITGGRLKVKETLTNAGRNGIPEEEIWEEKADQIRIYSGAKFEMLKEAEATRIPPNNDFGAFSSRQGPPSARTSFLP